MSTVHTAHSLQTGANSVPTVPPLQQGDYLTREEFHRRYAAMPTLKKAELIEGVVCIPRDTPYPHGCSSVDLIAWLGHYSALTPATKGGAHCSIKLDSQNEHQTEAVMIIPSNLGGQVRFDDKGCIVGAPEVIGEV